jgi:RHS repeat-associated protein
VTRRLFGPGVDEPIAREDASGNEGWYETDELGNVRGITSGTGTPLTTITYDGWGNVLSNSTSAQSDRYLKAGSQWDSALRQWVNGARVENGDGRWDQEDPTEFKPGDPNLYRYVGNDPANGTDPTGLTVRVGPNYNDPWTEAKITREYKDYVSDFAKEYLAIFGKPDDPLIQEIIKALVDSRHVWLYTDRARLCQEISLRYRVVQSARAFAAVGHKFGGSGEIVRHNGKDYIVRIALPGSTYWKPYFVDQSATYTQNQAGVAMLPLGPPKVTGQYAVDALNEFFVARPGKGSGTLDCTTAVRLIYLRAIAQAKKYSIPESPLYVPQQGLIFIDQAYFKPADAKDGAIDESWLPPFTSIITGLKEHEGAPIPGDLVTWTVKGDVKNKDYRKENTIFLGVTDGKPMYFAFGFPPDNILSEQSLRQRLLAAAAPGDSMATVQPSAPSFFRLDEYK